MANAMVKLGFKAAGYVYVNIDDCYLANTRDSNDNLVVNATRFPHGLPWLADQFHSQGLKLGVYEDFGSETCEGYPGSEYHIQQDAKTFASWKADSLKMDGCWARVQDMDAGYPSMTKALNQTGRPILYACSWPDYQRLSNYPINWPLIQRSCNYWRLFDDIQDSWDSVSSIIEFWGANQDTLIANAGPGHWNDPDMLIVGDFSLSYEESKTQFALWAIFAAPLFMSNDLRTLSSKAREILLNTEIIAVNQDPLGQQGRRIYNNNGLQVWYRVLYDGSFAVVLYNSNTDGIPHRITANFDSMQLGPPSGLSYKVRDLYLHKDMGTFVSTYTASVPVHGVVMLKVTAIRPQ